MASIQYYVDYNEQNNRVFNSIYKHRPGMNEIRKMKKNADNTYDIKPISAVSIGKMSFDEYEKLIRESGFQLVVFVDKNYINYFDRSSVHIFSHQSHEGIDYFNKIEQDKKNYKLLSRTFKNALNKSSYKTVLVSKDDKKAGFIIEQYPETLELKMDIVDRAKKAESIEGGLYLSLEGELPKELDKYALKFVMSTNGNFILTKGSINILPFQMPSNLPILEKKEYIFLLKKSLPVAIRSIGNGNYSVRLVTKEYVPYIGEEIYRLIPDYEKYELEIRKICPGVLNAIQTIDISSDTISLDRTK